MKAKNRHVFQMTTDEERYEWYTPRRYVSMAYDVLGKIDFDPCSSEFANETVQATTYYTRDDDALVKPWPTVETVWMNPPYNRSLLSALCSLFVDQYRQGAFVQGIVLINNTSDTRYWQRLMESCTMSCHVSHRIYFNQSDGTPTKGNTRGQNFFYFGHRADVFAAVFGELGICSIPYKTPPPLHD